MDKWTNGQMDLEGKKKTHNQKVATASTLDGHTSNTRECEMVNGGQETDYCVGEQMRVVVYVS